MPLDTQIAFVWTVQDGKLVRNEVFMDRRETLEAAGLRE
jgi:ketosteroid isomerase-like protein